MKNKKGNVAVIALIMVIVAITAGVVGWTFAKKTQAPVQQTVMDKQVSIEKKQSSASDLQPTHTDVNTTAEDWKTYTDVELGFKFDYIYKQNPISNAISDGSTTGLVVSVEKDGVGALYINFKKQSKPIPVTCQKGFKNLGSITIGGISTNKCANPNDPSGPAWSAVIQKNTIDGAGIYIISCSNEHSDLEAYCEKVLSTFKFTDQN